MLKYHAVLIVSKKPIDLSSFNEEEKEVQHYIHEEFELKSNPGKGGWLVENDASKYSKHSWILKAVGSTVSTVIVNWLGKLISSFDYEPAYKKHE
jgi:hypothetical protein